MNQNRRTQAARSQHAREQIAQAALTVFALKGFAAASMDDICMAAGCSKGGLYHHFPTKSAVLTGVVERLTAFGGLLPPFREQDAPLPPQALGRVLIDIWTEAARDEALRARTEANLSTILRIGTLIQMLTRADAIDAGAVARRLGIEQAA
ncbi:MAG: TetR/AcrR family transcriptional regulator [Dehalococcoidia bacterium]